MIYLIDLNELFSYMLMTLPSFIETERLKSSKNNQKSILKIFWFVFFDDRLTIHLSEHKTMSIVYMAKKKCLQNRTALKSYIRWIRANGTACGSEINSQLKFIYRKSRSIPFFLRKLLSKTLTSHTLTDNHPIALLNFPKSKLMI